MRLTVLSDIPLDPDTENKIREILSESSCPNESFKNTFGDATYEPHNNVLTLNGGTIRTILYNVEFKED